MDRTVSQYLYISGKFAKVGELHCLETVEPDKLQLFLHAQTVYLFQGRLRLYSFRLLV